METGGEVKKERLLDNRKVCHQCMQHCSLCRGNNPFNHSIFLPLIVHPWLANLVLFDVAVPLHLHISWVSRNVAINLVVQNYPLFLFEENPQRNEWNVSPLDFKSLFTDKIKSVSIRQLFSFFFFF